MNRIITAIALLALPACNTVLSDPHFEEYVCSGVDCTNADTLVEVQALPDNGMVKAQLECNSVAVGTGGAVSRFYYQATRYIDGSCLASATVSGPAIAPATGTQQASGANFWKRGSANAQKCLARAFFGAFVPVFVRVEGDQVHVETPTCGGGAGCTLSTAFCTGVNVEEF